MKKQVHFDINPHVIKQLGEELVSDEITALMELVKNSYDADASYVDIEINTHESLKDKNLTYPNHKGYILVQDDGFGMDEETILKSWLIISYSNKREMKVNKQKTPNGRTPLGEKGLGRLSTQRLANKCEIFTKRNGNKDQIHISFDWLDFESIEKLNNVPVEFENIQNKDKGTRLILSDLNRPDVWQGKNLESFKGQIAQMISPYQENKPFNVFLNVNGITFDLVQEIESLRDIALSRYTFTFNGTELNISGKIKPEKLIGNKREEFFKFISQDNGKKFGEYLLEKKNSEKIKFIENSPYFLSFSNSFNIDIDFPDFSIFNGKRANPGPFFGEINEFSFDNWISENEKIKSVFDDFSNYKEFAQKQVGIKLYRNGFAVKPFGIEGDDWLRLREAQTSANSYYYLRPGNIIGYFAIDEYENEFLKDKTDREGLVSNSFSQNFYQLAFFIRDTCNRFIDHIRRTYLEYIKDYTIENSKITTVNQAFNAIKNTSEATHRIKENFNNAKLKVKEVRKNSEAFVKSVKNNPLFSSQQEKETAQRINEIFFQLELTEKTLDELNPIINEVESLSEVIDILKPKIDILEEQLENFSELAALGLTAEAVSHEFSNLADELGKRTSFYSEKMKNSKLSEQDVHVLFEYINSTINGLKIQLRHLDPALKYLREKKDNIDLSVFISKEKEYYEKRFEKNNIKFKIYIIESFSININRGKLTQVLDNIFSNSEYWLKQRSNEDKSFSPEITIRIDKPWLYVFDNGYGIAPSIQDSIFEPFVTMKPKERGRGLGLFIVRQLLDSSGCSIGLEPKLNEKGRKYIFSLNLSSIIK